MADEKQAIDRLHEDLKTRIKQRDENEKEITNLVRALTGMLHLLPDQRDGQEVMRTVRAARRRPPTLKNAIFEVMKSRRGEYLRPSQIRTALVELGFDFDKAGYSQELTTVSMELARQFKKERLGKRRKGSRVYYTWADMPEVLESERL